MSHTFFDAYPNIKSGDVILWDYGFLTPLVKRITGEPFMRCGIAWRLPNGTITVLGAGLFSPFTFVKNLGRKTPFYWLPVNLELNEDVETYIRLMLKERPTVYQRMKNAYKKIIDFEVGRSCVNYLTTILHKSNFPVISRAEYKLSEVIKLLELGNIPIIKVNN